MARFPARKQRGIKSAPKATPRMKANAVMKAISKRIAKRATERAGTKPSSVSQGKVLTKSARKR